MRRIGLRWRDAGHIMAGSSPSPRRKRNCRSLPQNLSSRACRSSTAGSLVAVVFVTMGVGVNARTVVLAALPADPRRVRLGSRRDGGRVLVRLFGLGGAQPDRSAALMDRRGPRFVMETGVAADVRRAAAGDVHPASPGSSMQRSASWSAAAASASATRGNRCSCRTGSCAGAALPSASRSPASASARSSSAVDAGDDRRNRAGAPRAGRSASSASCCWRRSTFCCGAGRDRLGLDPDGDPAASSAAAARATRAANVVDPAWAAVDWTLGRAARTARFWWIALAIHRRLFAWYAVQVHQTKYLIEIGFSPATAAWALGLVSRSSPSPARSRSAMSPTASAANGCGRVGCARLRALLRGAAAAARHADARAPLY